MIKFIKNAIVINFILMGVILAQDTFTPPSNFEYNQSRFQAFYLFLSGDIDGMSLEEGDWIGSFNDDVCVGSWPWQGQYTAVPVMGDDGSQWTTGYMEAGVIPTFKIYDASQNTYYVATSSSSYPFEDMGTWVVDYISVLDDCAGDLGGTAFMMTASLVLVVILVILKIQIKIVKVIALVMPI